MKTFGELKPGDNLYKINRDKVKTVKISSINFDDTFSYITTYENKYNHYILHKDSYVRNRTFSCKEALNAHISKEINKLENRCNRLKALLDII